MRLLLGRRAEVCVCVRFLGLSISFLGARCHVRVSRRVVGLVASILNWSPVCCPVSLCFVVDSRVLVCACVLVPMHAFCVPWVCLNFSSQSNLPSLGPPSPLCGLSVRAVILSIFSWFLLSCSRSRAQRWRIPPAGSLLTWASRNRCRCARQASSGQSNRVCERGTICVSAGIFDACSVLSDKTDDFRVDPRHNLSSRVKSAITGILQFCTSACGRRSIGHSIAIWMASTVQDPDFGDSKFYSQRQFQFWPPRQRDNGRLVLVFSRAHAHRHTSAQTLSRTLTQP